MRNFRQNTSKITDVNFQTSKTVRYSGESELQLNESVLKNYNQAIIQLFIRTANRHGKKFEQVLDFGAGIGTLAKLFHFSSGIKPDCVEIDPSFRAGLARDGFCLRELSRLDEKSYDLIYTSNVLEHIQDDEKVVSELSSIVKVNGLIVIYVPAFDVLYSKLDERVGHYRRYSKSSLKCLFQNLPMEVIECRYVDSIGFVATWFSKLLQKFGFDTTSSRKSLVLYDRLIFPLSYLLDRIGFRWLIGKNLYVVARKIEQP